VDVEAEYLIKVTSPEGVPWLADACAQNEIVSDAFLETFGGIEADAMKVFSSSLYQTLISLCESDAHAIVDSVQEGCWGIEAYRLLKKRYAPKTPGTKRALLKSIINNPQCRKVVEVEGNLMKLEDMFKKYESMTTNQEKLPDDLKITVMTDLCHKELREHLEMSTKDLALKEVRDEILNYVERKRDTFNRDVKAMEVDNFELYGIGDPWYLSQANEDEWTTDVPEELNWIAKSKGKGKAQFFSPKGYGKSKSQGKGYSKGRGEDKGKGKGFQGECHWCGIWGHSASRCRDKDAYMQDIRRGQGMPEGQVAAWQGKGGGRTLNLVEHEGQAPLRTAVDNLEAQGGYRRLLCSVEVANRYSALSSSVDDDEPPFVPVKSATRQFTKCKVAKFLLQPCTGDQILKGP
jgi:hypothetical protein